MSAWVLRSGESVQVVSPVQVFSLLMACRYKLSLSLVVTDLMLLYGLPNGNRVNSLWLRCVGSMMRMQDFLRHLFEYMYWAVFTTHWRALS